MPPIWLPGNDVPRPGDITLLIRISTRMVLLVVYTRYGTRLLVVYVHNFPDMIYIPICLYSAIMVLVITMVSF